MVLGSKTLGLRLGGVFVAAALAACAAPADGAGEGGYAGGNAGADPAAPPMATPGTNEEPGGGAPGGDPSMGEAPSDADPDQGADPDAPSPPEDPALPAATQAQLIKTFAPHLNLHPADTTRPANVDWYLARVSMRYNHPNCPDHELLALGKVTQAALGAQSHPDDKAFCQHDGGDHHAPETHAVFRTKSHRRTSLAQRGCTLGAVAGACTIALFLPGLSAFRHRTRVDP
jgi:hypothetical protein